MSDKPKGPISQAEFTSVMEAVKVLHARIEEQRASYDALSAKYDELRASVYNRLEASETDWLALSAKVSEMRDHQDGMNDTIFGHSTMLEDHETLIKGRNKSAPTRRNMTDDDAKRVLTGDLKELDHKQAAEKAGLTYAQIYSCRLEYTFKHVLKELRDSGWKNPWRK